MTELAKTNGNTPADYMARDHASFLRAMRQLVPAKLPEWTDFESEADFGNALLELFAHMGDIVSYYQDRVANESFLSSAQSRRSVIHHLELIGYRLATAAPAAASLDLSFPAGSTGTVTVRRGDAFATKSRKDLPSARFEYNAEADLVIDLDALALDGGRKVYSGLAVEEGRLVADELLGVSDGSPNQRFPLTQTPFILRSLGPSQGIPRDIILTTDLGGSVEEWTLQESLAFSRAGLTDFVLDIDENDRAVVRFGDGAFGAIPPIGAEIRATYRVGGGVAGNVAAASIATIVDAAELALKGAKVSNPDPATGGAERESIEHAVLHAPNVFRSLKRAVTGEDYEALARDFAGVGKVRAEATNWNVVTLYVAPSGGGHKSDVLEANLLAYFEDKRPLSTVIEIEDVTYVEVFVTAEIEVKSYYGREAIREEIENNAGGLLAFDRVDFGQKIFLSKFYEAIEAIEGVDHVFIREFRRTPRRDSEETAPQSEDGTIALYPDEVAAIPDDPEYRGGIRVEITKGGF